MNIYIGADHRGFEWKKAITAYLKDQGHNVTDVGSHQQGVDCDYPQIAYDVATRVAASIDARGILLCMTGLGLSIAANKVPGAYAALCYTEQAAILSRQHNNANILVLGSLFVDKDSIYPIITTWLATAFEGGRHLRRTDQVKKIEKEFLK